LQGPQPPARDRPLALVVADEEDAVRSDHLLGMGDRAGIRCAPRIDLVEVRDQLIEQIAARWLVRAAGAEGQHLLILVHDGVVSTQETI